MLSLGLARGKYLLAGLHAAEASYVSSSAISAFRAAIVRAVWSSKMPLANAPAILSLLDGPVDVDPAFHIVWARLRIRCAGILLVALERNPGFFGCWISSLGGPWVMVLSVFSLFLLLN